MSLPPGWQQFTDPSSGNPYFHCPATGQTTWDRPSPPADAGSNNAESASKSPAADQANASPQQGGLASNSAGSSSDNASAAPVASSQNFEMSQAAPQGGATTPSVGEPANVSSQQTGLAQDGDGGDKTSIVPMPTSQQFDMSQMAPQGAPSTGDGGNSAGALATMPQTAPQAAPEAAAMPQAMPQAMAQAMAQAMPQAMPQAMAQAMPQAMPQAGMMPQAMPQQTFANGTMGGAQAQAMMQQAVPQQAYANGGLGAMGAMSMAYLMQMQQAMMAAAAQQSAAAAVPGAAVPGVAAGAAGALAGGDVKTGTVRSWNEEKGFGFVDPTDGTDNIFVHRTQLLDGDMLIVGAKVQFELEFNAQKGKLQGKNIRGAQGKGAGKGSSETAVVGDTSSPAGEGKSGQQQGTVKVWFEDRGFGFVTLASGEDCYVHRTNLKDGQTLVTGATINLEVEWDTQRNKYKALNVTGASSADDKGAGKGTGDTAGAVGMAAMTGIPGLAGMMPGLAGLGAMGGMSENRYQPF